MEDRAVRAGRAGRSALRAWSRRRQGRDCRPSRRHPRPWRGPAGRGHGLRRGRGGVRVGIAARHLGAPPRAAPGDVIVIADSGNWDIGVPALPSRAAWARRLRGRGPHPGARCPLRHVGWRGSGRADGPRAVARRCTTTPATWRSRALVTGEAADLHYPEARVRAESGAVGVRLIGTGSVVERLWNRPAVAVLAIDATPVDGEQHAVAGCASQGQPAGGARRRPCMRSSC